MNISALDDLTSSEAEILKHIAKTGFITKFLLSNYKRNYSLKNLIKKKLIIEKGPHMIFGDMQYIYILTTKGKKITSNKFLINSYKSDTSQLEHDFLLSKVYFQLNVEQQNTWINETEIKLKYKELITCDAIFKSNNKLVGVEIITEFYSKSMIYRKLDFIKKYCDDDIVISTSLSSKFNN